MKSKIEIEDIIFNKLRDANIVYTKDNILNIYCYGSKVYGVSTEYSDEDYIVVCMSDMVFWEKNFKDIQKNSKLKQNALLLLLHSAIGSAKVTKKQIKMVLDALPKLEELYLIKDK